MTETRLRGLCLHLPEISLARRPARHRAAAYSRLHRRDGAQVLTFHTKGQVELRAAYMPDADRASPRAHPRGRVTRF